MAKVVFCQTVTYSYFGIMCLSSVLKRAGHQVELVLEADPETAARDVLALEPDVTAFSTLTATGEFEWALQVAERLAKNAPTIHRVFGGIHPTLFPEESMERSEVDVLCRGEGEMALLAYCDRLDRRQDPSDIENLWLRTTDGIQRNPIGRLLEDLDDLPFPDRGLYQKYGYFDNVDSIDVLAGRSCPFRCSYCYNHVFRELYRGKGKYVRKHSPQYMIRELREVKRRYHPKSFTFVDELFAMNKSWLREFLEMYRREISLPFTCSVRADVMDDETASILARGGCRRVCFGLETGNETLRKSVLNKQVTDQDIVRTAEVLHRRGIRFLTTNMLGLPGETVENAFETIEMNQNIRTDYVWHSVFQPYPKLNITQSMEDRGIIPKLRPDEYDTTYFKGSLLRQENMDELVNLHKFFFVAFRFPWTKPILRKLIRRKPNRLYELVFLLSFFWLQITCFRRNPMQLVVMSLRNLKVFYRKKNVPPTAD